MSSTFAQDTPNEIWVYADALRAQGYSVSSIYTRTRLLNGLGVPPSQATREDILRIVGKGRKASTRRVYLMALRNSFRDMQDLGLVDHDPTRGLKTPTPPPGVPRPLTTEEIDAIMSVGGRVAAWTTLGLKAGLRASEVVGLKVEDVEWSNQGWMLRIVGKGGKDARIPAHDDIVALVHSFAGVTGRPWKINPNTMSQAWRQAAESVGVTGRRFHDCRHTYATTIYRHTGDLYVTQQLLRHSSIQTTQIYAAPDSARQFAAVAGL